MIHPDMLYSDTQLILYLRGLLVPWEMTQVRIAVWRYDELAFRLAELRRWRLD